MIAVHRGAIELLLSIYQQAPRESLGFPSHVTGHLSLRLHRRSALDLRPAGLARLWRTLQPARFFRSSQARRSRGARSVTSQPTTPSVSRFCLPVTPVRSRPPRCHEAARTSRVDSAQCYPVLSQRTLRPFRFERSRGPSRMPRRSGANSHFLPRALAERAPLRTDGYCSGQSASGVSLWR
jgi:hypothetical protein